MIQLFHGRREQRPTSDVIVFEAVPVRTGATWKALRVAKAALLIWGAVSLAGVAAAAVIYGQSAREPSAQATADPLPSIALASVAVEDKTAAPPVAERRAPAPSSLPAPAAEVEDKIAAPPVVERRAPAPSSLPAPAAEQAAVLPPPNVPAAEPPRQDAPTPLAERLPGRAAPPPAPHTSASSGWPGVPPASSAGIEGLAGEQTLAEPLPAARLPRARPDEPIIVGSIERRDSPRERRRYRRLHEFGIPYPYSDPYLAFLRQYHEAQRRFLYRR